MKRNSIALSFILLVIGLSLAGSLRAGAAPSAEEVYRIGVQTYILGYPLVLTEVTRQVFLKRFPVNTFSHAAAFPPPSARTVIRPNCDTLYSSAWLDLSQEPIILSGPDTGGRYYLVQIMDAWTETLAVPGKRTTGTKPGQFAIVGPNWKGTLPPNLPVIKSSTNTVWIIARTQTNTATDYAYVHTVQKGFKLTLLKALGREEPPAPSPGVLPPIPLSSNLTPPAQVAQMSAETFYKTLTALLRDNAPHPEDVPFLVELKKIGLVPGKPFDFEAFDPETRPALERAVQDARKRMVEQARIIGRERKGWGTNLDIGRYGTDYLTRAVTALKGLGALPPEEAIYFGTGMDREGKPLDGSKRYVLHLEKSEIPPVNAFWSVTLYDREGYFVPNPLNRFAIGDRDPLRFNPEGSLDLYIQHQRPGEDLVANWLPAPAGVFNLSLRLYWPKPEVINRKWTPPEIQRLD